MLAAELANTAIEAAVDKLHPDSDPLITRAKDCAEAAVLTLSIAAVIVFLLMLKEVLRG